MIKNKLDIEISSKCTTTLDLVETDKMYYYSFNLLGKQKINTEAAKTIHRKLLCDSIKVDAIITVEAKAIGLTEKLATLLDIEEYCVIRKCVKSYMKNPLVSEGGSIISGKELYVIDKDDLDNLNDKNILIVDDVISTGGTLDAIFKLLTNVKPKSINIACVLSEGKQWTEYNGIKVYSCGYIPVIMKEDSNDR